MEASANISVSNKGEMLFLRGARLAFGIWLLYIGAMKWYGGAGAFVGFITTKFAGTWIPQALLTATGWGILSAEIVLGLWLISGVAAGRAWLLTAVFMFLLTFGMTVAQEHATVANNWQYFFLAMAMAAWYEKKR